ncbi:MAG: flavin reductase, partial [Dorea sp.]|nr:flavin reductase [Dorea sp.]
MDKKAMYKLSYGLFVLTAKDGDKDNGCIINTAIQAASTPNQLSICVNKANFTHDMIMKTGEFTVSILSQKADFDLFKHFGFQSGKNVDKFETFDECARGANGIYYITRGTNAYISVKVDKTEDLGSHTMFVGEITDMEVLSDDASTTYEYYLNNIKPQPKKVEAGTPVKTVWRCKICGYEYEGEVLPEDYICPLCKHPASDFEKVVVAAEPAKAAAVEVNKEETIKKVEDNNMAKWVC